MTEQNNQKLYKDDIDAIVYDIVQSIEALSWY